MYLNNANKTPISIHKRIKNEQEYAINISGHIYLIAIIGIQSCSNFEILYNLDLGTKYIIFIFKCNFFIASYEVQIDNITIYSKLKSKRFPDETVVSCAE